MFQDAHSAVCVFSRADLVVVMLRIEWLGWTRGAS